MANLYPAYGSGIDTAVYEAAGVEELLSKRREIGPVAPGTSFITDGYRLPAKHIIHTVGTAWHGGSEGEEGIRANVETHPEFGEALIDARKAGVEVLFLLCHVEPDELVQISHLYAEGRKK